MSRLGRSIERAAALLIVFATAKLLVVGLRLLDGGGRGLLSPLAPFALFYQDVLAALLLGAVDAAVSWLATALPVRKFARTAVSAITTGFYVLLVLWVAFNVPVARVFSTPLTWSMLGTAGGALSDSIRGFVTVTNVCAVGAVLGVAAFTPRGVRQLGSRLARQRIGDEDG